MITLFISDMHIGDTKGKPAEVLNFLELQPEAERLVIVGDLLDLWASRIDKVLAGAKELIAYVTHRFKDNLIYLIGNHDADLVELKNINPKIREYLILNLKDLRILVMHGHKYDEDPYLKYFPRTAKFGAWAVSRVDKALGIDIRKYLMSLSNFQGSTWYAEMLEDFNNNLLEKTEGYDIVITGHTHWPAINRFDKKVILNTGDFMQHSTGLKMTEDGFYLLSLEDGKIKVLETYLYEDNKTQIQGGPSPIS